LGCIFGYLLNATWAGWRKEATPWAVEWKIIDAKKGTFNDVEAIVHIPNPLAHLTEQAGGVQGRDTGFHGEFIPASNYRI
jgi:hypothetical protein